MVLQNSSRDFNRSYILFLDDLREPAAVKAEVVVARSSDEALKIVLQFGFPQRMILDYDLGGEDTTMRFLKELQKNLAAKLLKIPANFSYKIISANPVGRKNIEAYLNQLIRVYYGEQKN